MDAAQMAGTSGPLPLPPCACHASSILADGVSGLPTAGGAGGHRQTGHRGGAGGGDGDGGGGRGGGGGTRCHV